MNTQSIDNILQMYNDGLVDEAAQEGQTFLETNVDLDVWEQFITGLIENGASKLVVGITDRCIEGPCYEYEFHRFVAKRLTRMKEWNRADAWRDKYRQAQADNIIQHYQDGNVDGAVAAAKHLFDTARMNAQMTLTLLSAISEAKADLLLIRIGNECLKSGKYSGDTYEFMAFEFKAIGELDLAIQWMEAHIGEYYLDFTRETYTLLEMLFDNGDVAKAEKVMQGLNQNLTDEDYDDSFDGDEGGIARLYALYAKRGAELRPKEKTRALFEQAIDYTQLGDGCRLAIHEAKEMYVEWLGSIEDNERVQQIRESMVSYNDRQEKVERLIDRWVISQWEPSDENTPEGPQETWQQIQSMGPDEDLISRFLFLVERFGNEADLDAICGDIWHKSVEEEFCALSLTAWLVAVLHDDVADGLNYITEYCAVPDHDFVERWARCLQYLLVRDYQGAAESAGQLLVNHDTAAWPQRTFECRQVIAYCELARGRHAEAAMVSKHIVDVAEKSESNVYIEVYSDAAKAFTGAHMNAAAAKAVLKVQEISAASREPPG